MTMSRSLPNSEEKMAGLLKFKSKKAKKKVKVIELPKTKEVIILRAPKGVKTGIVPRPRRYTYCDEDASSRYIVLLYARLGLHRYNFLRGKDLQLSSIKEFIKNDRAYLASPYNITLEAKDPETSGSLLTFKAHVNEEEYGGFILELPSSGPLGEPEKCIRRKSWLFEYPVPELPSDKNPFEDNIDRFLVLKKSEVLKNDWIRLYLELAVATTNRRRIENGLLSLKILKVATEITRDQEPFHKGLGAYDATFYIRYKDLCKSRVGDDIDRVAIVRRIVDVDSEIFNIVGRTQSSQTITRASNEIVAMEASSSSAQE